jgi:hypothetical protein
MMARPPGVRAHLDLEVDPQTDGPLTAWSRAVSQPEAPSPHVAVQGRSDSDSPVCLLYLWTGSVTLSSALSFRDSTLVLEMAERKRKRTSDSGGHSNGPNPINPTHAVAVLTQLAQMYRVRTWPCKAAVTRTRRFAYYCTCGPGQ